MSELRNFGIVLIWLSFFCLQKANGQAPTADFSVSSSSACLNERIALVNNSVNATRYEWDFCLGDLEELKDNINTTSIPGLSQGFGYKLVEDNGIWYGFAVSQGGSKLFRLEFGDNPMNEPEVTDLGNLGLTFPHEVAVYKNNGIWYGFVTSNELDYGVVKLNFGSQLTNAPTATNIGNFGISNSRIWSITAAQQNSDYILVMSDRNGGTITRVNFRESFDNPIVPASHVFTTGVISGGGNLTPGVEIINTPSGWIALLASYFDNKIYQVNFGNDLLSTYTVQASYTFTGVNRPFRVRIAQEGDNYYAVIANDPGNPSNDPIQIVNFNDMNPANTPVVVSHTGLPELLGIDVARFHGRSIVHGVGLSDNKLTQLNFESECGANKTFETTADPVPVTYNSSGVKRIELRAFNSALQYHIKEASVTLSPLAAPDIEFITDGRICAQNDISFSSQNTSGDIMTYDWDFGDVTTAGIPNPTHQYGSSASYDVVLTVTSSNTCTNTAQKTVKIYAPPVAAFSTPSGLVCTNNEFTFTNGVTDSYDGNLAYQWKVETDPVSADRDLKYTFTIGGDYDIALQVSIPGCSDEKTLPVNSVQVGPVVGFSQAGQCESDQVSFTNLSSGNISGYQWNFGNGNNSTEQNPVQTYSTKGTYTVSLETTGVNGCVSSTSKQLKIYSKPQPDFSIELPPFSCSGTPSQFTNTTANPTDSNVASWAWQFGDATNGTSSDKNALYTFSKAGDYNVTLKATTNFNCSSSTTHSITIAQGPPIAFSNTPSCANQGTRFNDESGNDIKSWLWTMGNSTYAFSNPTHVFSSPGDYNVQLTVTGNNSCVATLSKTITVPAAPVLDFSFSNTCEGQPTTFEDASPLAVDPVASQSWDFASNTKTGSPVQYSFTTAGTYAVKMTSTQQSGCVYSVSKNVVISAAPVAKFSANPEWGTSPLPVQFTNQSTGANSYLWRFNDKSGSTSTEVSPAFRFTDLGDYVVDLIATNAQGCSNTVSSKISVIVPSLDVELTNLNLIKDPASGSYRIMVTIKNKSNFVLTSADVIVDISGNARIKETLSTSIAPDGEISQLLTNQIVPGSLFTYLCAELDVPSDIDSFNNKICESINDEGVIFTPYPNPSNGEFRFDWIAHGTGEANFAILNSMGQVVFQQDVEASSSGLNQAKFDLTSYQTGIYFFKFNSGSLSKTIRILIVR